MVSGASLLPMMARLSDDTDGGPDGISGSELAMEPSATAETLGEMRAALPDTLNGDSGKATVLQRMNDINSGGNTFLVTVVTSAPKKSAVTTAQENTANFPRPTMSITVFGNTTSAGRYSTIVNEPGGTIAVPGVPSVAFEEVTKNFLQNIINSTSTENLYTIHTTVSGPGGATAPNGDPTTAIENATEFHEESSASQDDVPPVENPATTTSISTENPIHNITGKTITQSQDNTVVMVTSSENVPDDLPDITHGKWRSDL
uniref:Uncharacterized protein n=1 Tax=Sphaerodactylus townsendi TaxID=933632 RepID=A0ACB8EGL5_9SAUR